MPADGAPPLPSTALLIAPTPEAGAALGRGFDAARTVEPAALGQVLDGATIECVAVTGVPVGEGALAALVTRLLAAIPGPLQVLLDIGGSTGAQLARCGPAELRGLTLVGTLDLSGVPCLRFVRADDPSAVPDLDPVAGDLDAHPHARARLAARAGELLDAIRTDRLEARVRELERELETAHDALAAARAPVPTPQSPQRARRDRKLALLAVAVGVAVAVAVLLALATGTGYDGGLLTLLVLMGAAALGYTWHSQRRLAAAIRSGSARAATAKRQVSSGEATRRRHAALTGTLADLTEQVTDLQQNLRIVTRSVFEVTHAVERLPAVQDRASVPDLHQTQAIANLFATLPVDDVVPLMGGDAPSPDVILLLVQELRAREPRLVVECGSGVSTLWMALAIRKLGLPTRIVALDHDADHAARTRQALRRHGVAELAQVRDAPLRPVHTLTDHETEWYDTESIGDLADIGLLFVDGPPEATGVRVRYPAVPLLAGRFAPATTIVLDDYERPGTQEIARAWLEQLPEFTLDTLRLERGAAVLRRS